MALYSNTCNFVTTLEPTDLPGGVTTKTKGISKGEIYFKSPSCNFVPASWNSV